MTARRPDEWAEQHALAKGMEQKRRERIKGHTLKRQEKETLVKNK
jgi:hypothetical protein